MLFAVEPETIIAAIFAGLGGLLVAGVTAYGLLKKAWADAAEKAAALKEAQEDRDAVKAAKARNGVLEEWEKAVGRCSARVDALEKEVVGLREQVTALYAENSKLRGLIAAKETRVEEQAARVEGQAAQVEKLQTTVTLLKDLAPITNLPAGTEVKIPESTMKETEPQAKV